LKFLDKEVYFKDREYCWLIGLDLTLDNLNSLKEISEEFDSKFIVISNYNKNLEPFNRFKLINSNSNVKFVHDTEKQLHELVYSVLKNKIDHTFLNLVRIGSDIQSLDYNILSVLLPEIGMCELKDEMSVGVIPENLYSLGNSLLKGEKDRFKTLVESGSIQVDNEIVYSISDDSNVSVFRLPFVFKRTHYISLNLKDKIISILSPYSKDLVKDSGVQDLYKFQIRKIISDGYFIDIKFKDVETGIIVEASQVLYNSLKG